MGKKSFRTRRGPGRGRCVGAAFGGIVLSLVVACWTASAQSLPDTPTLPALPGNLLGTTSSTPGSSPTTAPTATPTPSSSCPTPVLLPVGPSLLPSPSPAQCTALVPTPPGATPTSQPQNPDTTTSLNGDHSNSPNLAPAGSPLASAGLPSVQQSGLLQLLGLLGTPANVGVETPALQHFGNIPNGTVLTALATPATPLTTQTGAHPHLPPALWAAMVLSLLAAVALSVVARRRGRARFARLAEIAAVPFLLVVVLGAVAAVPKGGTIVMQHTQPAAPAAAQAATVAVRSAVTVSHQLPSAGDLLLARLETYEAQVADYQSQIQVLTALANQASPGDPAVPRQRGPFDNALDPATTAHQEAASLESTLQEEYAFFVSTARDPSQADALLQAASTQSMPVRETVAYDVQAVQAQLAQEAAIAQATQPSTAASATTSLTGAAPTSLGVPINGVITQGFGPSSLAFEPALTFDGVTYPHFHTGLDIAGPFDSPVAAAADGVVAIAGAETDSQGHLVGYGNYIVIAHAGKMITLYGHLDQLLVHVGQVVHAGDLIGLEGTTGNSTGPHVHFEVRIAGLLSNPLNYLAGKLSSAR